MDFMDSGLYRDITDYAHGTPAWVRHTAEIGTEAGLLVSAALFVAGWWRARHADTREFAIASLAPLANGSGVPVRCPPSPQGRGFPARAASGSNTLDGLVPSAPAGLGPARTGTTRAEFSTLGVRLRTRRRGGYVPEEEGRSRRPPPHAPWWSRDELRAEVLDINRVVVAHDAPGPLAGGVPPLPRDLLVRLHRLPPRLTVPRGRRLLFGGASRLFLWRDVPARCRAGSRFPVSPGTLEQDSAKPRMICRRGTLTPSWSHGVRARDLATYPFPTRRPRSHSASSAHRATRVVPSLLGGARRPVLLRVPRIRTTVALPP